MYSKDKTEIIDRREMLRVKAASLAAESRIIRKQEQRTSGALRAELAQHRRLDVRIASRSTVLALGFIRGKNLDSMEPLRYSEPDWEGIQKMLTKYGPATKLDALAFKNDSGPKAVRLNTPRVKTVRVHKPDTRPKPASSKAKAVWPFDAQTA